mmetsp:Transcript_44043/g.140298  ORF Transcript_44043/g.140298 Transcript_44043/m.140298 type:complete len:204 (+) Transcript_44043:186-797(+)
MGVQAQVEFEGRVQGVALPDDSAETWQRICAVARELSDLERFDLNYEDEDGYPRALSLETLGDLLWVAEGSACRVRLWVREPQDNVAALDAAVALLLRGTVAPAPCDHGAAAETLLAAPSPLRGTADRRALGGSSLLEAAHMDSAYETPEEKNEDAPQSPCGLCSRRRPEGKHKGSACLRRRKYASDWALLSDFVRQFVSQMF